LKKLKCHDNSLVLKKILNAKKLKKIKNFYKKGFFSNEVVCEIICEVICLKSKVICPIQFFKQISFQKF
jgi:hypothetical protein